MSGLFGFSETERNPPVNRLDSVVVLNPAAVCPSVSPTDVPDVGVQAHVFGGFLELEAGVGGRQLPAAVRMPRQIGDGPLQLVRISEMNEHIYTQSRAERDSLKPLDSRCFLSLSPVSGQKVVSLP